MPLHDCVTAIGQLQDTVTLAAEQKSLAGVIMLDQRESYDLLDHEVLLVKMAAYNFHQHTVKWFRSYLSGRRFSTIIETAMSETRELGGLGVSQGSVLGSLLFVLSLSDLPDQLQEDPANPDPQSPPTPPVEPAWW